MAKTSKSHHVIPALDGGWSVRKTGADRASKNFPTKEAAESWARIQSIKDRSDLVIHRRDGMVAEKISYGSDPRPPQNHKK
jgi:hypothetical protein